MLIGVLAVQIGLGARGKKADSTGALHAIAAGPGGAAVLWRLAEATGRGRHRRLTASAREDSGDHSA